MTRFLALKALAVAVIVALVLPASVGAQENVEDAGLLEGVIQNALGGEGRDVRVIGLRGVLSSEASIARIEVADDDGTWLVIQDVVLDWSRLALLRRRLEVEALTIGTVELRRQPLPVPASAPQIAADETPTPFSLPQLPVAVNVQEFSIDSLVVDDSVTGQPLQAQIDGSASLANGEGSIDLDLVRTDGQQGSVTLDAGFENQSRRLLVDLVVAEEEGGLISSLAGIPGAPSLDLTIQGDAPISDFTAVVDMSTDGVDRLDGTVTLTEEPAEGLPTPDMVITADISGDVADLFLPDYRDFFGRNLSLELLARSNPATGVAIEQLDLQTRGLTLAGRLNLSPEFVPKLIDIQAHVGTDLGLPVVLPLPGPPVLVGSAGLTIFYDQAQGEGIRLSMDAEGVMRSDGYLIDTLQLAFDGALSQAESAAITAVSGDLDAVLDGFSTTDPALWDAVGDRIEVDASIDWADQKPLLISGMNLNAGEGLSVSGDVGVTGLQSGLIEVSSDVQMQAADLDRFSAISGQPLSGALDAAFQADYDLAGGGFTLQLTGQGHDLSFGQTEADHLLEGDTSLAFSASRTSEGIAVEQMEIDGQAITLDGSFAIAPDGFPRFADITGRIGLEDGRAIRLPLPGATTELQTADLRVSYDAENGEAFETLIEARGVSRADGIHVGTANVAAEGNISRADRESSEEEGQSPAPPRPTAVTAAVSAIVSDASATDPRMDAILREGFGLTADVVADLRTGLVRLTGTQAQSGDLVLNGTAEASGLMGDDPVAEADLTLESGPLSRFAALIGQDVGGAIRTQAAARYHVASGYFSLDLDGSGQNLSTGIAEIDDLIASETVFAVTASRDSTGIVIEGLDLDSGILTATGGAILDPEFVPRAIDLTAVFGSETGAPITLSLPGQTVAVGAASLDLSYNEADEGDLAATLRARNLVANGVTIGLLTASASGEVTHSAGALPETIAARVTAEIAQATADDPALAAAVRSGAQLSADVDYRASAATAAIRDLSLTSGDLTVTGEADISGIGQNGTAAIASLSVDTGALSRFAPLAGRSIAGRLVADAEAAYETATGNFEIDLSGNASGLRTGIEQADAVLAGETSIVLRASRTETGLELPELEIRSPQLVVQASGGMRSSGGVIDLDARLNDMAVLAPGFSGALVVDGQVVNRNDVWSADVNLQGPGGTSATVSGDALRPDGTVDLRTSGSLPLGLANRLIAPRSINGDLRFDLAIQGEPGLDAVSGNLSVSGGRVADPATRLAVQNISGTAALSNGNANIDLNGQIETGGQVSISGPIDLRGNFPANLDIALNDAILIDPSLYEVNLDAALGVDGPLAGGATISGRIDIGRAEIRIPSGAGGAAPIPDITHVRESRQSYLTRERAGLVGTDGATSGGTATAYPLDIVVSAPQQIFIRGRGLNAELGGRIVIRGTTASLQPEGALELIRGDLALLGQRLEFEEATISLQGDLVPDIRMVATSSNDTIRAQIIIEGPITDPEISLTSEPELPEDEVLAQLFFNKPVSELSPLEVAQLAAAVRELSGGGGGGLFEQLREGLGVDNLDFQSNEEGTTSVTAGKYISDRVYSDVTASSDGTTEIQLNYEIRRDLKARAGFDSEGNTGIGITFERDY